MPNGAYIGNRRNLAEILVDIGQRRVVGFCGVGGGTIGRHDYIIVPHEGVARCTFDADIADTSRKYERSDAVRAENGIQISVMESIEPMLGDNDVMFGWADVSVEFGTPSAGAADWILCIATFAHACCLLEPHVRQVKIPLR